MIEVLVMNKKRKINIFRFIWVTGIFAMLIVILLMVIDYKVNYQYLEKNYLYFYDCEGSICTTYVDGGFNNEQLYSIYECGYEQCPSIKTVINEDYVVLNNDSINILYNIKDNKIISNSYDDYYLINDKYFIVTMNNYQGIINIDGELLVNTLYEQLGYFNEDILSGYNIENIIAKKNGFYGIISIKSGDIIENFKYGEENIDELLKIINS